MKSLFYPHAPNISRTCPVFNVLRTVNRHRRFRIGSEFPHHHPTFCFPIYPYPHRQFSNSTPRKIFIFNSRFFFFFFFLVELGELRVNSVENTPRRRFRNLATRQQKRMLQQLIAAPPPPRFPPQTLLQKIPSELRQPPRKFGHLAGEPDPTQRVEGVSLPRRFSGEHLDHRASQRPHVRRRTLPLPANHLRRHPQRTPARHHRRKPLAGELRRRSEVGEFAIETFPSVSDEDVLSFHVAVNDAV
ncbi:hypothetical protein AAZV13_18G056532 [Glycine max]